MPRAPSTGHCPLHPKLPHAGSDTGLQLMPSTSPPTRRNACMYPHRSTHMYPTGAQACAHTGTHLYHAEAHICAHTRTHMYLHRSTHVCPCSNTHVPRGDTRICTGTHTCAHAHTPSWIKRARVRVTQNTNRRDSFRAPSASFGLPRPFPSSSGVWWKGMCCRFGSLGFEARCCQSPAG